MKSRGCGWVSRIADRRLQPATFTPDHQDTFHPVTTLSRCRSNAEVAGDACGTEGIGCRVQPLGMHSTTPRRIRSSVPGIYYRVNAADERTYEFTYRDSAGRRRWQCGVRNSRR